MIWTQAFQAKSVRASHLTLACILVTLMTLFLPPMRLKCWLITFALIILITTIVLKWLSVQAKWCKAPARTRKRPWPSTNSLKWYLLLSTPNMWLVTIRRLSISFFPPRVFSKMTLISGSDWWSFSSSTYRPRSLSRSRTIGYLISP